MIMKEKVSIVIPAYNAATFIERTVENIKKQTYPNWELLIVNDGSKDNTGTVIDKIATTDERIAALHQENGGEVSARRTGAIHASGKWVMFVDADDMLPETAIASLIKYCQTETDVIVGTMHVQNFKPTGEKFEDYVYQNRKTGIMDGTEFACGVMTFHIQMAAWGKLYKKSILDSFPWCLDREIRQNPDLLMNVGIGAYVNKVCVTNEVVYEYLIHEGTASSGVMPFANWMRLFDAADKYIKNYAQPEKLYEAFFHYRMERFDCMLRHGIIDFPKKDTHVVRIVEECTNYMLTNDEKKVKILLQNMLLRKVFNWWQKRKQKNK